MAGLCGLKALLLWAGIILMANSTPPPPPPAITTPSPKPSTQNQTPPAVTPTIKATTQAQPPQCSYTVTPIKGGFRIDMINSNTGNYNIKIEEEGKLNKYINENQNFHKVKHLKPCTEYEHSVIFIDDSGKETVCNSTERRTMTGVMMEDDVNDGGCMSGYVCYRSVWDLSSSLPPSYVPAESCKSDDKEFCIKPGFNDICTELTTTFTPENCLASSFSITKSITVDFLNPSDIKQTAPTELGAEIKSVFPPKCTSLTIDYTCRELNRQNTTKKPSDLDPFTEYNCTGQIKENNKPTNHTTAIMFRTDCDIEISDIKKNETNTSIALSWTTTSENCSVNPGLKNLTYDCSCHLISDTRYGNSVPAKKTSSGGTCHVTGLKKYTNYMCGVQPKYNNKEVGKQRPARLTTEAGKPEGVTKLLVTVPEHNVIKVTCTGQDFNGPKKEYVARLLHDGFLVGKLEKIICEFEFRDLNYSTNYTLEVTAFNGKFYSNPKKLHVTTLYNDKALKGCLVVFFIIITSVAVVVAFYIVRRKNDVNRDVRLEPIYANVPQQK